MTGALDIVAGFPIGQIGYLINGIILHCIQFDRKADSIYGDANHQSELIIYTWATSPKSPLQNLQKAIPISLELYMRQFPILCLYHTSLILRLLSLSLIKTNGISCSDPAILL